MVRTAKGTVVVVVVIVVVLVVIVSRPVIRTLYRHGTSRCVRRLVFICTQAVSVLVVCRRRVGMIQVWNRARMNISLCTTKITTTTPIPIPIPIATLTPMRSPRHRHIRIHIGHIRRHAHTLSIPLTQCVPPRKLQAIETRSTHRQRCPTTRKRHHHRRHRHSSTLSTLSIRRQRETRHARWAWTSTRAFTRPCMPNTMRTVIAMRPQIGRKGSAYRSVGTRT